MSKKATPKSDVSDALDTKYNTAKEESAGKLCGGCFQCQPNKYETRCSCSGPSEGCPECSDRCVTPSLEESCDCATFNEVCPNCQDTERAYRLAVSKKYALENAQKELAAYARETTKRRTLVEELKSTAETEDGGVGESNTVRVSYDYGLDSESGEFRTNIRPVRATLDGANSFAQRGDTYSKLQLAAHIKNLQAILSTLS